MEDVTKINTTDALIVFHSVQRDVHIVMIFFHMALFKVGCDELKELVRAATPESLG